MFPNLDTYNYIESTRFVPKSYNVTISDNDKVITIDEGGSLLACLGLKLDKQTLTLTGKDNEDVASVDLPNATGIESIDYDKTTHEIIFVVNTESGEKQTFTINISDLIDIYEGGNGIVITQDDENNNKIISIKINEEDSDILSADENGLAINLDNYPTNDDVEKLIEDAKEDMATKDDIETISTNVNHMINTLNNNIVTIVNNINQNVANVNQRAINKENELEADFNAQISSVSDELSAKVSQTDYDEKVAEIEEKLNDCVDKEWVEEQDYVQWDNRNGRKHIVLDNHNNIIGKGTDGGEYNVAMISKWNVADFGSNAIHLNLNSNDKVTINDNEKVATESWVEEQGYLSETSLDEYAKKEDIPSLDGYATEEWVENKGYLTDASLDEYAKKEDIPSLDGYATEEWVEEQDYIQWDERGERKHIVLGNHNNIIGKGTDGGEYNVAMISKWNVADFGSSAIHLNLNSNDKVTINDNEKVATESWVEGKGYLTDASLDEYAKKEDIPSLDGYATEEWVEDKGYLTEHQSLDGYATEEWVEGQDYVQWDNRDGRKHIVLDNHNNIIGKGKDGGEFNVAMISKWNVADFGSNAIHLNLNTFDNVTINDKFKVATESWVGEQGYLSETSLDNYYTKAEISNNFIDNTEMQAHEASVADQFNKCAKKEDLANYLTKDDADATYATKLEVASKIDGDEAEEIAQSAISSALVNYLDKNEVSEAINNVKDEAVSDAVSQSNSYADEKMTEAKNAIQPAIETALEPTNEKVTLHSNQLNVLSTCNDGEKYDAEKAMANLGSGVVDELYRLLHSLLNNLDENNLTYVNQALQSMNSEEGAKKISEVVSEKSFTTIDVKNNTLILE